MAVGKSRYLEMAVDMALSLREQTTLPIALASDEPLAAMVADRYQRVFDEVRLVPPRFRDGRALKFGAAEASPFEETMFLDADCVVLASLERLWSALEAADMAMLGEFLTADDDAEHHGFSTKRIMRHFGLERYLKTNSGIFVFRRTPALEIMEECLECYFREARPGLRWRSLLGGWLGDEIVFGIVGGRRRLGTLPLPHPMYWPPEFDAIDLAEPQKPLLHMIWPPPTRVLEGMLAATRARRRLAGIPGDAEAHWREEIAKLDTRHRGPLGRLLSKKP